MAEREPGQPLAVLVPPVPHEHALAVAKLPVLSRKVGMRGAVLEANGNGGRQPTARLGRAHQDVGQRPSHLLSPEPALQHGGDVVGPRHGDRGSGVDHDDGPVIGRGHAANQLFLAARKIQVLAVVALALRLARRADAHDRHIGVRRRGDGTLEQRVLVRRPESDPEPGQGIAGSGELDGQLHRFAPFEHDVGHEVLADHARRNRFRPEEVGW